MTKSDQLNFIRQKCIEANPEKGWNWDLGLNEQREKEPVRLTDVLLAIEKYTSSLEGWTYQIRDSEMFIDDGFQVFKKIWNLRADDLNEQSGETIQFIHELLK